MYLTPLCFQLGSKKINIKKEYENYNGINIKSFDKAGFKFVYHCDTDENIMSLATLAIKKVPSVENLEIDVLIGVSSFYEHSPHWVHELNELLPNPSRRELYALQDACTGYLSALTLANSLISSGGAKTILIATGDTYSKYFNNQPNVTMLFSDSFSFSLISKENFINDFPTATLAIEPIATEHFNLSAPTGSLNISSGKLEMHGAKVFQFVIRQVPKALNNILSKTNISASQVDWFVHQGSRVVVNEIENFLALDNNTLFTASEYGNTVSNSIPIQFFERKPIHPYVGLLSFGMGLAVNVMIGRWKA